VDKVQSYNTVEPAIDLTARSFLMFAWGIAGAPEGAEANWQLFLNPVLPSAPIQLQVHVLVWTDNDHRKAFCTSSMRCDPETRSTPRRAEVYE
jgi:hypothetical protein